MDSASFFSSDSQHRQSAFRDTNAPIYSLPVVLKYDKGELPDELDAFKAAAQHMANIMSDQRVHAADTEWGDRWRAWEKQQFRKVVRRAKPAQFDRLAGNSDDVVLTEHVSSSGTKISLLSTTPHPSDKPDPRLKNFQVAGLSLPKALPVESSAAEPVMLLTPHYSLGASTGKMLAQVCHAVQLMIYSTPAEEIRSWETNGRPVLFLEEYAGNLPLNVVEVVDAGFTELPPNSVTISGAWLK